MLLILTGDFPIAGRETSSCAVVLRRGTAVCTGLPTNSQAACVGRADAGVLSQAEVCELDRRRRAHLSACGAKDAERSGVWQRRTEFVEGFYRQEAVHLQDQVDWTGLK